MGLTKAGSVLVWEPSDSYIHLPLGLPVDLQYLPPDKQREPDPDIRKMLIEAIMLVSRGPSALNPTPTPTRPH